jgi:hypothetical protein
MHAEAHAVREQELWTELNRLKATGAQLNGAEVADLAR